MSEATFRFYAELNEFLPAPLRQQSLPFALNGPTSVKHAIEAMGVPHTEVDLILANGEPVGFDYRLHPGDLISVYPPFTTLDVGPLPALRPPLPDPPRFILDVHLGQLATYLRLLGFDALYSNEYDDEYLAEQSRQEGRVLVSRDRRLLMRKEVVHGCCLRTRDSEEQLYTVLRRYNLFDAISPWQRCLRCNGPLRPVAKEEIIERLEPKTKQFYDDFHICEVCDQIYWKGSHYPALQRFVEAVRANGRAGLD